MKRCACFTDRASQSRRQVIIFFVVRIGHQIVSKPTSMLIWTFHKFESTAQRINYLSIVNILCNSIVCVMRLELPTYNAFIDAIGILSNTKQKLNDGVDTNSKWYDVKANMDDIDNSYLIINF